MSNEALYLPAFCILLVASYVGSGCALQQRSDPYAPISEAARDTQRAAALNEKAQELLAKQDDASLAKAETLLRESLGADLYFGPAHNNLGVIYLSRGQLFEAAGEFEWARKLMPGHPDPRINLAMTLESAGRNQDAMETYRTALEVYPDHIAAMQGLARLQIKSGKPDEKTEAMLAQIAMRGETAEWKEWAKSQLVRVR